MDFDKSEVLKAISLLNSLDISNRELGVLLLRKMMKLTKKTFVLFILDHYIKIKESQISTHHNCIDNTTQISSWFTFDIELGYKSLRFYFKIYTDQVTLSYEVIKRGQREDYPCSWEMYCADIDDLNTDHMSTQFKRIVVSVFSRCFQWNKLGFNFSNDTTL